MIMWELLYSRGSGIWYGICSMAGWTPTAHQWTEIGSEYSNEWQWTTCPCWCSDGPLWWDIQVKEHRCKSWCFSYALWHVENPSREVLHVAWGFPIIWDTQGDCICSGISSFYAGYQSPWKQAFTFLIQLLRWEMKFLKDWKQFVNQIDPILPVVFAE